MRLIDADAFKEILGTDTKIRETFCKVIDAQPTAYDVEKVIQQLREHEGTCTGCNHRPDECEFCAVKEKLDIVKRGGVK